MAEDSEIMEVSEEIPEEDNDSFTLIHSTSNSLIYRIRHDGKFFIVKRSALKGERGNFLLRREYELSIGCDHPNIVHVYEYRRNPDNRDEIIMEYIEGRTLSSFISENPSLKTRKRIFRELLDAVEYLHSRQIVHNDLKPENIMVSRTGNHIKLLDLGLSDDDAHFLGKTPGFTSGFAAPELIEDRNSDIRSDIYSLGVIMRLLFGKNFSSISDKCIRKNPRERYQEIKKIKKDIDNAHLRIIIPTAITLIGLIVWGIISLAAFSHSQNEKIENFKSVIAQQNNEIENQKTAYSVLESQYLKMRENIENEKINKEAIEHLKKEKTDAFKNKLSAAYSLTLDSISHCDNYVDAQYIRINYYNKVQKLYKEEDKFVAGEDISPELYYIMVSTVEAAYKNLNEIDILNP